MFVAVFFYFWTKAPRHRVRLIGAASVLFYASWNPYFVPLLLFSAFVDYWCALRIVTKRKNRRRYVVLSLVANLGLLAFFKYSAWLGGAGLSLINWFGLECDPFVIDVLLPIGISFYTFQTIAYTIDVYRREIDAVRQFDVYFAYVTFFPQLIAGPIERPGNLVPQIQESAHSSYNAHDVRLGLSLILRGYIKKLVIADSLAIYVDNVFGNLPGHSGASVVLATIFFAVQIYCDFSGYTDIARGVARLFGIRLMENFNYPYFATSIREFWRRWHISLSTWLRDYLYIPLGGNRSGTVIRYRNLLLTMVLGGIWHGAAYNFLLWGAYHGVLLVLEEISRGLFEKALRLKVIAWLATLSLVLVGWFLFRVEDIGEVMLWLTATDINHRHEVPSLRMLIAFGLFVSISILEGKVLKRRIQVISTETVPSVLRLAFAAVLVFVLAPSQTTPFIYFQF